MIAKVKATGGVFKIEGVIMNGIGYVIEDVEILPSVTELYTKPDWEQRRYEIAKDIYAANEMVNAVGAVACADELIDELQKPKA